MKTPNLNIVPLAKVPALMESRNKAFGLIIKAINELGQHKPAGEHYLGAMTPLLADREAWLARYDALQAIADELAAEVHLLERRL